VLGCLFWLGLAGIDGLGFLREGRHVAKVEFVRCCFSQFEDNDEVIESCLNGSSWYEQLLQLAVTGEVIVNRQERNRLGLLLLKRQSTAAAAFSSHNLSSDTRCVKEFQYVLFGQLSVFGVLRLIAHSPRPVKDVSVTLASSSRLGNFPPQYQDLRIMLIPEI
jgi:hypothetical protein